MRNPNQVVWRDDEFPAQASRQLAAYGFCFSIFLFFYGALFPFTLDLSNAHLQASWQHASLIPYWDTPGNRMHGIPDIAANLLLFVPLGFFGFLYREHRNKAWALWRWWALAMALGLAAEILQFAVPGRSSGTTDIINNGLGTLAGAAMARAFGKRVLDFLTGSTPERRNIYLWMLISTMFAIVGPLDIDPDYFSRLKSGWVTLASSPWPSSSPIGQEWVQMLGFALIGALASRLAIPRRRKRSFTSLLTAVALIVFFPWVLECARLLVQSNPPLLYGLALDLVGSLGGFILGFAMPGVVRPPVGFIAANLALLAAGLTPLRLDGRLRHVPFQWMPFYEFCTRRTPIALYEVVLTLFSFALLGGLMQLSFIGRRRGLIVGYAIALAGAIEFAQTILTSRTAGVTDILIAGLGAWTGALFCAAVESSRGFSQNNLISSGRTR